MNGFTDANVKNFRYKAYVTPSHIMAKSIEQSFKTIVEITTVANNNTRLFSPKEKYVKSTDQLMWPVNYWNEVKSAKCYEEVHHLEWSGYLDLSPLAPAVVDAIRTGEVSMNMMGEVMAIFEGQKTLWDDPEGYWSSFCDGLVRISYCLPDDEAWLNACTSTISRPWQRSG
jgi:hypothetical protein